MQVHVFVSGSVQGVGFRQFVQHFAKKFALTGWAKNLSDGRLEIVLRGEEKKVKKLVSLCRKGPFLARVRDVQAVEEKNEPEFSEFTIIS